MLYQDGHIFDWWWKIRSNKWCSAPIDFGKTLTIDQIYKNSNYDHGRDDDDYHEDDDDYDGNNGNDKESGAMQPLSSRKVWLQTLNSTQLFPTAISDIFLNKGIGDAGSTADMRMLWSAMVCYSLPWSGIMYVWYFWHFSYFWHFWHFWYFWYFWHFWHL